MKNRKEVKEELIKRCKKHNKISIYSERRINHTYIKALLWFLNDPRCNERNIETVINTYKNE